jgi:hypothetical protein
LSWLHHWLASGDAILLIIGLICLEGVIVALIFKGKSRALVLGLVPGLCLALALYCAVTRASAEWIGIWLTLSLPAHLADFRARWAAART